MFGLWTRTPRTRKPVARRTPTLCLERLEDRLSPSRVGGIGGGETLTMNVTYHQGKQATFSGQLSNANGAVANQTINLTGVVAATVTTNATGSYSITLKIPQLGTEYAASSDGLSNIAQFTLVGGSPVIGNFKAVAEGGGLWLFTGNVSGAPTQGEVVSFGGINALQGKSTTVNANGTFSFCAVVNSGQGGWASAEATDWWGDTSEPAAAFVGC